MRTLAIVPVKRFAVAKQRLGASIADPLRLELARAMVADVLLALERTPSIEYTIVVTGEHSVARAAREQGSLVLADTAEQGQSEAVTLGVRAALVQGVDRVLCVPGDCPALEPAELEALLEPGGAGALANGRGREQERSGRRSRGEVVIVPDRHGTGTNGLLLTPPDVIVPGFGPDSFKRHRARADAAGASWRVERTPSLLLDIDTGADLAVLRERLAGARGRAGRTRAALGRPERTDHASVPTAG
ncbi:MAG: NTP transferase domain-containing protein [Solirubrobacteraceae bacterium]